MGTLIGSYWHDRLEGTIEGDLMDGRGGNDILLGGFGDDTITGGLGNDSMAGNGGDDTYYVDSVHDVVLEWANEGNDAVYSSVDWTLGSHLEGLFLSVEGSTAIVGRGNGLANFIEGNDLGNRLYGAGGQDTIGGGLGDDTLSGGNCTDFLHGQEGNDHLFGGAGSDLLYGGAGADMFHFTQRDVTLDSADTLVAFSAAEGDRIHLRNIDAIAGGADNAFTFIGDTAFTGTAGELRATQVGGWTDLGPNYPGTGAIFIVEGDVNGDGHADFSIQVNAIGSDPLAASDFVL